MGIFDWFNKKEHKIKKVKMSPLERFEKIIKNINSNNSKKQTYRVNIGSFNVTSVNMSWVNGFKLEEIRDIIKDYKKILANDPLDKKLLLKLKIAEDALDHLNNMVSLKKEKIESPIINHINEKLNIPNLEIIKEKDSFFNQCKESIKKRKIISYGALNIFCSDGENDFNFLNKWIFDKAGYHFFFPKYYPNWIGVDTKEHNNFIFTMEQLIIANIRLDTGNGDIKRIIQNRGNYSIDKVKLPKSRKIEGVYENKNNINLEQTKED